MGFEQYHEPANELSDEVRTFARIIVSLTEEAEAIMSEEVQVRPRHSQISTTCTFCEDMLDYSA